MISDPLPPHANKTRTKAYNNVTHDLSPTCTYHTRFPDLFMRRRQSAALVSHEIRPLRHTHYHITHAIIAYTITKKDPPTLQKNTQEDDPCLSE